MEKPKNLTVILVVDDNDPIRTTLAAVLRDEGYTVHTAQNGRDALEAIRSTSYAVLLVDLQMPVMDGWELLRSLQEEGISVPVVVMSAGRHSPLTREFAVAAYLEKPFDVETLLAILGTVTAGSGNPRSLEDA